MRRQNGPVPSAQTNRGNRPDECAGRDWNREAVGKIEADYEARGIPATYLIGRDGIIRKRVAGASDWNTAANRALVAQLLGVPDVRRP